MEFWTGFLSGATVGVVLGMGIAWAYEARRMRQRPGYLAVTQPSRLPWRQRLRHDAQSRVTAERQRQFTEEESRKDRITTSSAVEEEASTPPSRVSTSNMRAWRSSSR